jgi:NAD-dependent deacetylase
MAETMARLDEGETDPPCLVCGGILKSDTISFGQNLIPEVIDRAMRESENADVLIAAGSSLGVYPAANCVPIAARAGAGIVIVNGQPTAMDDLADERLLGGISEILPVLVQDGPAS